MKMSGMKVLGVVLFVLAVEFVVLGLSGQSEVYLPGAACFVLSMALFANLSKMQSETKDGESN